MTRDQEPCATSAPTGPACGVVRYRTVGGVDETNPADAYSTTKGTSATDARLPTVAALTDPAYKALGTPARTGSLTDALAPWQQPPPGHGDRYAYYEIDQPETVDGVASHTTRHIWLDTDTRMPLRDETISGDYVDARVYFSYEPRRYFASDLPSDEFRVGVPDPLSRRNDVDLATQSAPAGANDPVSSSNDGVIQHDTDFRRDFGLNTDATYVQSLLTEPQAQATIDEYGVPLSASELGTMRSRDEVEPAARAADAYGTDQAAPDYAGTWIDQQDGTVHVAFKANLVQHEAALLASFPYPSRLRVVPAVYAQADLDATAARVVNDIPSLRANGLEVTSVGVNDSGNRVEIGAINPSAASTANVLTSYGSSVVVQPDNYMRNAADDAPVNRRIPPTFAGLQIADYDYGPNTESECTGAFTTLSRRGIPYQLTAGHCGHVGDFWCHNNDPFGIVTNPLCQTFGGLGYVHSNAYRGATNADAETIGIDPRYSSADLMIAGGSIRHITGAQKDGSGFRQLQGNRVCQTGFVSAHFSSSTSAERSHSCGRLSRRSIYYVAPDGVVTDALRVASITSCTGDSGGPVYQGGLALGLVAVSGGRLTSHGKFTCGSLTDSLELTMRRTACASEC